MAAGISSWNGTNSSNIEIDANNASGISYGIWAQNEGNGSTRITVIRRVTEKNGISSTGPTTVNVKPTADISTSVRAIITSDFNDIINIQTVNSGPGGVVVLYDGDDTANVYSSTAWAGAINGGSGEDHVKFLFAREEITSFQTFIDQTTSVTRFERN